MRARLLISLVLGVVIPSVSGWCMPTKFYLMKPQSERYLSYCPSVFYTVGIGLSACLQQACVYSTSGNVINFRNNQCDIRKCSGTDLQLSQGGTGWDVYVYDEFSKCTYAEGRTLSCWTCHSVSDNAQCAAYGKMEACTQSNPICGYEIMSTTPSRYRPARQLAVSRGCRDRNQCYYSNFYSYGYCTSSRYRKNCIGCTYIQGQFGSHCIDGGDIGRANEITSGRNFYLFSLRLYKMVSMCPQLVARVGYSKRSCWRLAAVLGGNMINFNPVNGECDVRDCVPGQLQLSEGEDDRRLYAWAVEIPCDSSNTKVLACWQCDTSGHLSCYNDGDFEDCSQMDEICTYTRVSDPTRTLVSRVTRTCRARTDCSMIEIGLAPGMCGLVMVDGTYRDHCNQCMFEDAARCHDPWDLECHERFLQYTDDYPNGDIASHNCSQIFDATTYWRAACFDAACQTGANLVMHHKADTRCILYACDDIMFTLPQMIGDTIWYRDPDECILGLDTCVEMSVCVDTIPGFQCDCFDGYVGDGKVLCQDEDECQEPDSCPIANAACVNSVGSYTCVCPNGFSGDGYIGCDDIDECEQNNGGCDANAQCFNLVGSYRCQCDNGYDGDGVACHGEPCKCEVQGDPQLHGFDDARYPLFGWFRYLLSENADSPNASCVYEVYVQTGVASNNATEGDYYMDNVLLIFGEDPQSEDRLLIFLTTTGVFYQTDNVSQAIAVPVPGNIAGTNLQAAYDDDGMLHVNSTQAGCDLLMWTHFDKDDAAQAKVVLQTSREYVLDGACGNCNGMFWDEFAGAGGEDLTAESGAIGYINRHYAYDLIPINV